jgi:hypothetical protein
MRKKLLNYMEQQTDAVLQETCQRHSVRVFVKPRIADVLPIENSGISDELYSYALKGHFDFVVVGSDMTALFVVEFDGPSHQGHVQQLRDLKKKDLCHRFTLPNLQIDAEHINRKYRNLHLLTWFVEVWFANEVFQLAQKEGQVPLDEPYDPSFFISIPGLKGRFPLWLSAEPTSKIQQLFQQGRCVDFAPAEIVGDVDDAFCAFACLRISEREGVWVRTALRNQRFPASSFRLIQEIIPFHLIDKIQDVLDEKDSPVLIESIRRAAQEFSDSVHNPTHIGLMWL